MSNADGEVKAAYASELARERIDMMADVICKILANCPQDLPTYMPIYLTGEGIGSMRGAKKYLGEQLGKNIELVTSKLPGFVKPEDSSKTSLLVMADTLSGRGFAGLIKRIIKRR